MSGIGVLVGAGLRGRRRTGLVATFAVLVLAAVAIAAGLEVSRQGGTLLDAAAADADVAHLVLYGDREAIAAVAADDEVLAWSGPFEAVNGVELPLADETVPIEVTALDSRDIDVNHPPMRSGRWAAAPEEIVLDYSVSVDLAIDDGEAITLRLAERDLTFTVVGTAVNFTDCFYPQCEPARTWVTQEGLDRFEAGDRIYSVGYLRFDDAAAADPFVERQAAAGVEGITGSDSWLDTREDFLTIDRVFGPCLASGRCGQEVPTPGACRRLVRLSRACPVRLLARSVGGDIRLAASNHLAFSVIEEVGQTRAFTTLVAGGVGGVGHGSPRGERGLESGDEREQGVVLLVDVEVGVGLERGHACEAGHVGPAPVGRRDEAVGSLAQLGEEFTEYNVFGQHH